ncbi:NUDIX domain-containing protein [Kitasatospora sp. NPDC088134]|uniref:NUDIX domain-containing protein n=1 Tax=Kitasatospora sp. NPDC088134 TaxID=3364071 RepID=UPI00382CC39E
MPATTTETATAVRAYLERRPDERERLLPLLDLLDGAPDPTMRPVHVTCSGVVVDRDLNVLHVRGPAAGPQAQPGGDEGGGGGGGLLEAAIRAVTEGTGLAAGALCLAPQLMDTPVDIGSDPVGSEGARLHFDFRYVFHLADGEMPPADLKETGAAGAAWCRLSEVSPPGLRAGLLAAGLTGRPEPVNASALVHNGRGQYLLHLRDNFPHIWAPGEWSLLGGGREAGDATIEATLRRELAEEVPGLNLGSVEPLTVEWTTDRRGLAVPIQIFTARWDGHPDEAGLREGVLVHWFRPQDLHRLHLRASTRRLVEEHATAAVTARPPATGAVRRAGDRAAAALPVFDPPARARAEDVERTSVSVLLTDRTGRVLLVRRAPGTLQAGLWELPGGGTEPGEGIVAAGLRELAEEAGITAARVTAHLGHKDYTNSRGARTRAHVIAACLDHVQQVRLSAEHDGHRWVLPAELPEPVAAHEAELIRRHTAPPPVLPGHLPLPAYLPAIPAAPMWGSVFFTTRNGRAVLLRATDPAKGLQWPGGDVEFTDPSPLHTAVRECAEETGILLEPDADRLPLLAVVFEQPRGGWPAKVGFAFHGGELTPSQVAAIRLDPAEHTEVVLLSRKELAAQAGPRRAQLTLAVLDAVRTGVPAYVVR